MLKNYYPEKPAVAFKKTTVSMEFIIEYLRLLPVSKELKRAVYIVFRNESANGSKGINNNYVGCQADSGRWQSEYDDVIVGVVKLKENKTGKERLFCAFKGYTASVDFLVGRLQARGVYVGGYAHKYAKMQINNATDLSTAYKREWVTGTTDAIPTKMELENFLSMYKQAQTFFI